MPHEHDWVTPSPLWGPQGYRQAEFFQPAIFEYRSDDFMEGFLAAAAAKNPATLAGARLLAPANGQPNSLYLPSHGCFYLAAASLVCRLPGFPERLVRRSEGERVGFVLRKLVNGTEYGWVVTQESRGWQAMNATAFDATDGVGRALLKHEELLPVFPVPSSDGRQVYGGYIPVSSSETYKAPPAELVVKDKDGNDKTLNVPIEELGSRFTTPLTRYPLEGPDSISLVDGLPDDVAHTTCVYLLMELWDFLQTPAYDLREVADAVQQAASSPTFTGDRHAAKSALYDFLKTQSYKGSLKLAGALKAIAKRYADLNKPGGANPAALGLSLAQYSLKNNDDLSNDALQKLLDHVEAALPAALPPLALPKFEVSRDVRYVLRFVYHRPQCDPPIIEISLPSQPFVFAPFFDPEAPARPIRIPLPSDVSIAGMRKFKKNVTFMMSDAMRKKMNSVVGKEETLLSDNPETNLEDGGAFAFVCSFSIQIIFIVAFMLLLIFVVVFNLIFWWLAFFKICLPVPKALIPE